LRTKIVQVEAYGLRAYRAALKRLPIFVPQFRIQHRFSILLQVFHRR